jgi:gentisate 1,2-dioxygenase
MTETDTLKNKFTNGLGSARFIEAFSILEASGLRPLGKSNTRTLLYQYRDSSGVVFDIFAFRLGPALISFPESYWLKHKAKLSEYLSLFSYSDKPILEGFISTSQYSAGQIKMTRNTIDQILAICREVSSNLSSLNNNSITG